MEFLHSDFSGGPHDVALVTIDSQANVMLLSDSDFVAYRAGRSFHYYGGWATRSPIRLSPPHEGHWHIVVDLGGNAGRVGASIRIIHRESHVNQ